MNQKQRKQQQQKRTKELAIKRRTSIIVQSLTLLLTTIRLAPFRKRLKIMWLIFRKKPEETLLKYLFPQPIKK